MPKPRKTPEQKIAALKQKQDEIKAREKKRLDQIKAQIQNENAKLAAAERKRDTRRKIIAGAIALEHMEHDEEFAAVMHRILFKYVKESDKELFGL